MVRNRTFWLIFFLNLTKKSELKIPFSDRAYFGETNFVRDRYKNNFFLIIYLKIFIVKILLNYVLKSLNKIDVFIWG